MHLDLTRILLLMLALTLNGQAFAAPCGVRDGQVGEVGDHHHAAAPQASAHCAEATDSHHCHQSGGPGIEPADSPQSESCEQACSCCPGHCASAITASEHTGSTLHRLAGKAFYSEPQSSPLPEATIRPPIRA